MLDEPRIVDLRRALGEAVLVAIFVLDDRSTAWC